MRLTVMRFSAHRLRRLRDLYRRTRSRAFVHESVELPNPLVEYQRIAGAVVDVVNGRQQWFLDFAEVQFRDTGPPRLVNSGALSHRVTGKIPAACLHHGEPVSYGSERCTQAQGAISAEIHLSL